MKTKEKPRTVSFKATKAERTWIWKIAERAARDLGVDPDDTEMDVCATHANGCPLDLERFHAADAFNFAHDIFGIARHLDRDTGELTGCFLPRFYSGKGEAVDNG